MMKPTPVNSDKTDLTKMDISKINIEEMNIENLDIKNMDYQQLQLLCRSLPRHKRAEFKEYVLRHAKSHGIVNIYQDLQMHSQYVEAHKDITHHNDIVQLHSHSFYEFIYYCAGSPEYLLGTERHQIQKGDIIIVPPGLSHRPLISTDSDAKPYERIAIWLSADLAEKCQDLWTDFPEGRILHSESGNWNFLHDYFTRIYLESDRQRKACESVACGNALALLGLLSRALSEEVSPTTGNSDLLDNVIYFIETHLNQKITLEETASHFFVSQSTLSKLFRGRLNQSFYQFVTQCRLTAAKQLINQGLPLKQIGEQTGFCDYAAFYRAFKREYGLSPVQYKNLLHKFAVST